jgi:uncharacterized membrane protein
MKNISLYLTACIPYIGNILLSHYTYQNKHEKYSFFLSVIISCITFLTTLFLIF